MKRVRVKGENGIMFMDVDNFGKFTTDQQISNHDTKILSAIAVSTLSGIREGYFNYDHNSQYGHVEWKAFEAISKQIAIKFLINMADQMDSTREVKKCLVHIGLVNMSTDIDFNTLLEEMGYDVDECHQMIRG
jgi:hypothetical protein